MKYFYLGCFLLLNYLAVAQSNTLFNSQLKSLHNIYKELHFAGKPVDDSLSVGVYHLFINNLDEDQNLLRIDDFKTFSSDSLNIDNYLEASNSDFIDKYVDILTSRIEETKDYIASLSKVKLDYTGKDTIHYSSHKKHYYKQNKKASELYWNKIIKYEVIKTIIEEDSTLQLIQSNFAKKEEGIKNVVIEKELCKLNEITNQKGGVESFVKECFLKAYCAYQDPHSTYFNNAERDLFHHYLGTNQLTYGILPSKNKDNDLVVEQIIPGSSAFKNGEIEEDDVIKSITSGQMTLETYCISINEVDKFLNDDSHKVATFKIKKRDGTIKEVKLAKTIMKSDDNSITGFVLKSDEEAFGYIKIPSFYTDFDSPRGIGISQDFSKELYKLQKENIKGLIIDLRFNGGGSIHEATNLSGMFIDKGPIAIESDRYSNQFTIRDPNRGSLFTKPVVIMINESSASASEFFSGAMQDYNRALIVGSNSFGKGTAQVILPLDTLDLTQGYTKITFEKFYRATGKGVQQKGIAPDIQLPSLYENFNMDEKSNDFSIPNDDITPTLALRPLKKLPIEHLTGLSKNRVEHSEDFKKIKELNQVLLREIIYKNKTYALTIDNVFEDIEQLNNLYKSFQDMDTTDVELEVENTKSTIEVLQYSEDMQLINEDIMNNISHDIYISESFNILKDLINKLN